MQQQLAYKLVGLLHSSSILLQYEDLIRILSCYALARHLRIRSLNALACYMFYPLMCAVLIATFITVAESVEAAGHTFPESYINLFIIVMDDKDKDKAFGDLEVMVYCGRPMPYCKLCSCIDGYANNGTRVP